MAQVHKTWGGDVTNAPFSELLFLLQSMKPCTTTYTDTQRYFTVLEGS